MAKIISAVSLFLLGTLVSAFFCYQFGKSSAAQWFLTSRHGAPVIILTAAPVVYLLMIYFIHIWQNNPDTKYSGFPPFLSLDIRGAYLTWHWERISIAAMLYLPILFFGWFWIKFFQLDVWTNTLPPHAVSAWEFAVSPTAALTSWNDHRIGQIAYASVVAPTFDEKSVSFSPGYQLFLIMIPLSVASVVCAFRVTVTHLKLRKTAAVEN